MVEDSIELPAEAIVVSSVVRLSPPSPPRSLHECLQRLVELSLEQLAHHPRNTSPELLEIFVGTVRERVPSIASLLALPLIRQLDVTGLLPTKLDAEQQRLRRTTHFLWVGRHGEIEPTDVIDMYAVPEAIQDLVQLACNVLHEKEESTKSQPQAQPQANDADDDADAAQTPPATATVAWNLIESDIRSLYHDRPALQTAACGFLWTFVHIYLLANLVVFGRERITGNAAAAELVQAAWQDTFRVMRLWLNQLKVQLGKSDDLRTFGLDKYTPKPSLIEARDMTPSISRGVLEVARVLGLTQRKAPSRWSQHVMESAREHTEKQQHVEHKEKQQHRPHHQAQPQPQARSQQRASSSSSSSHVADAPRPRSVAHTQPTEKDKEEEEEEREEEEEEEEPRFAVTEKKKTTREQEEEEEEEEEVEEEEEEEEEEQEETKTQVLVRKPRATTTTTDATELSRTVAPSTNTFDHTAALHRYTSGPKSLFGASTTTTTTTTNNVAPATAPKPIRKSAAASESAPPRRGPGMTGKPAYTFRFTGDD